MSQLNALTLHLLNTLKPYVKPNDIDAWQTDGQLHIIQDDLGEGINVAKWRHSAVIAIERLPHTKFNPYTILAILAAWLSDNDWPQEEYGLSEPAIDIDIISDDHAQMIINIDLVDDLGIVEDEQGNIPYMGKKYRLENIPINWAEQVDLINRGEQ